MTNLACDVCGKKCAVLTELVTEYQTTEVKEVCDGCLKVLNVELDKVRKATRQILFGWMRRFIQNRCMEGKDNE